MEDLKSKTLEDLVALSTALGWPAFKAKELFRFIHALLKEDLSEMTTLSKPEREQLKGKFGISKIIIKQMQEGERAHKASFQLEGGAVVESVLMEYEKGRSTLCLSCQAGCPVGCLFCATGRMRFKRNLSTGEILSQVYYFARNHQISNIVFMGMGEPFLNYEAVLKAARILNHPLGLNIAARKIVFSTIGITAGIKRLITEPEQFRLAWSLVSPFDKVRRELVPLPSLPPVAKIISMLKQYQKKTKRRITIEYVTLADINDKPKDVEGLIRIAKQLDCHVNLIPYNSASYAFDNSLRIKQILAALQKAKVNVTVRASLGKDISAACGQLAA